MKKIPLLFIMNVLGCPDLIKKLSFKRRHFSVLNIKISMLFHPMSFINPSRRWFKNLFLGRRCPCECHFVLHRMWRFGDFWTMSDFWWKWSVLHTTSYWNSLIHHWNYSWSWIYWIVWIFLYHKISYYDSTINCSYIENFSNFHCVYCSGMKLYI